MLRNVAIVIFCLPLAMAFSQPGKGPVARYSFNNGNARDEIGGNHAKEIGVSFGKDRFGNSRSALYTHGNDGSYLNLGTSKTLKPQFGSISLWFKVDIPIEAGTGYSVNPIILTKSHGRDDFFEAYSISYFWPRGTVHAVTAYDSTNQIPIHTADPVLPQTWHHVVYTYDDDSVQLFFDGHREICVAKNFRSRFLEGDSVILGHTGNLKNHRFFNGFIDDLEIYDRVLDPIEVKVLYEARDPKFSHWLWMWILKLSGIVLLLGIIVFFISRRYKKMLQREIERNKLQNQMNELEIKAIKAQMNPHFIFNSLNSIQQFILSNDNENAYKYLTKFSKLVRKLLESTTTEDLSLEDEVDLLTRYLEIESLRFEDMFSYEIQVDPKLRAGSYRVPHMIIQPFVENAIWHGLLHKKGERKLVISFSYMDEKCIICKVEDNGIGRSFKTEEIDSSSGKRSLAIDFIKKRLDYINELKGLNCGFRIIDKEPLIHNESGTRVEIKLPIM
jgi:hypothetical protein